MAHRIPKMMQKRLPQFVWLLLHSGTSNESVTSPHPGGEVIPIADVLAFEYDPENDELNFCFTPEDVALSCFINLNRGRVQ